MDGLPKLLRRVALLDAQPDCPYLADSALRYFIYVMEQTTHLEPTSDGRTYPLASPGDADALLKTNRLLDRLMATAPEIVAGPLRLETQYWARVYNPNDPQGRELLLSESQFIGVPDIAVNATTKPFQVGLFTSTGAIGTYGMWRIYLEMMEGSAVEPRLWRTWAVEPSRDAVIHEIASASQWVDFVRSHPLRDGEHIFPDWASVARHCDAVHMTLRAIAATQGLNFPTPDGIVATGSWDVESTLWLRWCFRSVRLVEETVTDPHPPGDSVLSTDDFTPFPRRSSGS